MPGTRSPTLPRAAAFAVSVWALLQRSQQNIVLCFYDVYIFRRNYTEKVEKMLKKVKKRFDSLAAGLALLKHTDGLQGARNSAGVRWG